MNKQRMQKSGCSMLVAALVGLLPLAAVQAQERSLGQEPETETMGTQGPLRQDMDEVQQLPATEEQRGAEGPLREAPEQTFSPEAQDTMQPGAKGPLRQDTGTQGPIRAESDFYLVYPEYRGMSQDFKAMPHEFARQRGAEGPMGAEGAEGPVRGETDFDRTYPEYSGPHYR